MELEVTACRRPKEHGQEGPMEAAGYNAAEAFYGLRQGRQIGGPCAVEIFRRCRLQPVAKLDQERIARRDLHTGDLVVLVASARCLEAGDAITRCSAH